MSVFLRGVALLTRRISGIPTPNSGSGHFALKSEFFPEVCSPVLSALPQLQQCRGLKILGKPHLRCRDCYFEVRDRRLYVFCKTHPRHKQMAMKKREDKYWILTHATQSPKRPW